MAARLIATAQSHGRGWTLSMPNGSGSVQAATFEAVVAALQARTGTTRLLIIWVS
jgi:hypothetical protein